MSIKCYYPYINHESIIFISFMNLFPIHFTQFYFCKLGNNLFILVKSIFVN